MSERRVGELVGGRYRLASPLAEGGMGALWVAEDVTLRRPVAIKLLGLIESPAARQRFATEAMVIARLDCPHIVKIYDYAVDNYEAYIAMELMQGEDLAVRFERCGRMTLRETATLVWHVAMALAEVHDARIVHRDLKPGNVFLAREPSGQEAIKLLDFGVAKLARGQSGGDSHSGQTQVGSILGTPHYMSPEQARGFAYCADHRADLWALGIIAYQALTGDVPFDGNALPEILVRICTAPIPRVSHLVPGLPPALDAFFDKALARKASDRFSDAREMADAFVAIARDAELPPRVPGSHSQRPAAGNMRDSCAPVVGSVDTPAAVESMAGMMVDSQRTLLRSPQRSRVRAALTGLVLGAALIGGMVGGGMYGSAKSGRPAAQSGLAEAARARPSARAVEVSLPRPKTQIRWRHKPPYGQLPTESAPNPTQSEDIFETRR